MNSHAKKAYGVLAVTGAAVVCLATVGALVAGASNGRGVVNRVQVVEKEMSTHASPTTVKAGKVTFVVHNAGTVEHELLIMSGVGGLSVHDFRVPETRSLGEAGDILPGKTKSVTLTLKPGKYTLLCNIAGHYMLGMHTVITVR